MLDHAPAIGLEEACHLFRVNRKEPGFVLHNILLIDRFLSVPDFPIDEILADIGEGQTTAARGPGQEIESLPDTGLGQVLCDRFPDEERLSICRVAVCCQHGVQSLVVEVDWHSLT